jgi:hypothetical protein
MYYKLWEWENLIVILAFGAGSRANEFRRNKVCDDPLRRQGPSLWAKEIVFEKV